MPALSEYSNVYNTALLLIRSKGYQIWYEESTNLYGAEKDGWDFLSPTPCGLLGLITIHEAKSPKKYSEYWWRIDGGKLYGKGLLPTQPKPYTPVYQMKTYS